MRDEDHALPGGPWPAGLNRRQWLNAAGRMSGAALLAGGLAACGAPSPRPLLSADTNPEGYPTVEAVKEMSRLLAERTQGRLSVRVYSGGRLGAERDTLELASFGGLDMTRVYIAPLNAIEPTTTIPALPFLFRSTAHMRAALDGPPGQEILESLTPHGLVGLCYYDSGERCIYNTKRPIRTPQDMKGLKIRVPNSDLYLAMLQAMGADPTPMDLSEVYQSLVQGVVDGAENNWPSYESGRHFEAAPYYSLTRHVMAPEVLVISRARWEKMSPDNQDVLRACARESVPFMRALWDRNVAEASARLIAAGVKVNEVDDPEAFAVLMRPLWDRFARTPQQKRLVQAILDMAEA